MLERRMRKVPSLFLTLAYPPNALPEPDFCWSRAELTPREDPDLCEPREER